MESNSKIQSVARALTILNTLAEARGELALNEIERGCRWLKVRSTDLSLTLKDFGFIEQSTFNGKYKLGVRLFEVGQIVAQGWEVRAIAVPILPNFLRSWARQSTWSSSTNLKSYTSTSGNPVGPCEIVSQVGMRLPAHCTGVGKMLMAHLPAEKGVNSSTPKAFTDLPRTR